MIDQIVKAIEQRHKLLLTYDPGPRIIEPHAVGIGSDGQVLLRAYQTSGASKSGESPHWKLFRVDRVDRLNMSDETFDQPRHGYVRGDRAMKQRIIAQL